MIPTERARETLRAWRQGSAASPFERDAHLRAILLRAGWDRLFPELAAFADRVAGEMDGWAIESNRPENLPRLSRYDALGHRTEQVAFHPTYHALGRAAYATGVMTRYKTPGQETASLAIMYLYSQNGEAGHACPLACTAGLIKMLQQAPNPPAHWLEHLYDPKYDQHYHGSQFLTEVQGGSDVGANVVRAEPTSEPGWYLLSGEKWFCSVIDAHLFLVSAREQDRPGTPGIAAFVVPRHLEGGAPNGFRIRRLKDKLGTRSMASAEVDFDGARGYRVGDFREVVRVVLNTSRLYNAAAACGLLQRAWREAASYAKTRRAFGVPIQQFAGVAQKLADIRANGYGARASSFLLATVSDDIARGTASEVDTLAWRMLVNLNKYWTAVQGTRGVQDAIEVLGGNGAIEDFSVLPRLLRDSVVIEAWEGGHNVLCAQALRDAQRSALHRPMFAFLRERIGASEALEHQEQRWELLLERPDAEALIRPLVDDLRVVVQSGLLRAAAADGLDPAESAAADHLESVGNDPWTDERRQERIATLLYEPGLQD
jgi:alkylation response protein AidB-like acyl-CoA dehydrogenase